MLSYDVTLRGADVRLADDEQIVLRLGTASDVDQTIRASLGHYFAYAGVLSENGLEGAGALPLSVYLKDRRQPSSAYRAGPFQRAYRTTTVGRVRAAGVEIWATAVAIEGQRLPLSDAHADLVVSTRSDVLPDAYAAADKTERRRLRELLRPEFEAVLAVFDAPLLFDHAEDTLA